MTRTLQLLIWILISKSDLKKVDRVALEITRAPASDLLWFLLFHAGIG